MYKQLSTVHKQLYLHGTFPENIAVEYFNRKQPEVIEQRKEWALTLLEFIASQHILNTHPIFVSFLFDTDKPGSQLSSGPLTPDTCPLGGTPGTPGTDQVTSDTDITRRSCTSPDLSDLEVLISPTLSVDTTPTLTPDIVTTPTPDIVPAADNNMADNITEEESHQNLDNLIQDLSGQI